MADQNKTEKATPQRRKKAREQGQVARSRELSNSLAWAGAMTVVAWQVPKFAPQWQLLLRNSLDVAVGGTVRPGPILFWMCVDVMRWVAPVLATAWLISLSAGLAQGGLVFATEALLPNPQKFNPATKLSQMFSLSGLSGILKSLIPFSIIAWIGYSTIQTHWPILMKASEFSLGAIANLLFGTMWEVCWKSGLVLVSWAAVDYFLVRQKLEGDLKMSRQELRDEYKQSEGNPTVKGRIRRIQRSMRRRQMLRDTEKASVVITNPTHFAVALRYEMAMEAPVVVAKGRDLLAQEIKEVARWHNVPILENPPLAQSLFKTVEVGQQIPAELYAVVAEILAFVLRAQAQARGNPKGGSSR